MQNIINNVHSHPSSIDAYIRHGWSLTPIPYMTKGPTQPGWNRPESALKSEHSLPVNYGIGLLHAYSGTCAIDIDDFQMAQQELLVHGIDLNQLYNAPDAVQIISGKPGRGKLLYSLPSPMKTKKIVKQGQTILELRCEASNGLSVQDVLPSSIHPETGKPYQWGGLGHWSRLPTLPDNLIRS